MYKKMNIDARLNFTRVSWPACADSQKVFVQKLVLPAHTLIRIHRRTMFGPRVSLPGYAGVHGVGI